MNGEDRSVAGAVVAGRARPREDVREHSELVTGGVAVRAGTTNARTHARAATHRVATWSLSRRRDAPAWRVLLADYATLKKADGVCVRKTRGYAPLGGAHGLGLGDRGEGHGGGDGRHLELSCGYVKSAGVCDDGGQTRSIAELRTNSQSWASLSSRISTNHDAAADRSSLLEVRVRFRIEIFRIVE